MDKQQAREPYEPPAVEDVPFRSEEQVLAGCKGGRHAGPQAVFFCSRGAPCRTITPS